MDSRLADVVEVDRFLRAAREDLLRLRAALKTSRDEVARAKLELAKAKQTLAEVRQRPDCGHHVPVE